jgi:hypothetical protein
MPAALLLTPDLDHHSTPDVGPGVGYRRSYLESAASEVWPVGTSYHFDRSPALSRSPSNFREETCDTCRVHRAVGTAALLRLII